MKQAKPNRLWVILPGLTVIIASTQTLSWARHFTQNGWNSTKGDFTKACVWWLLALVVVILSNINRTKLSSLLRTPQFIICLIAITLFVGSGITWWRLVYSSPANVFERMLATSLSTPSVTKTVVQSDETQRLNQSSLLISEPEQIVHALNTLEQIDDTQTRITTESIGTPTTDYVRYTDIITNQKNAEGGAYDFSNVIGTWGKAVEDNPGSGNVQLFNQTVLGVVPIANLRQPLRAQLLEQISRDGVYSFKPGTVKRQLQAGRPVYVYDVSIEPEAYVKMLKSFARALGLTQLEQVDPSQYKDSPPLEFTLEVDVWSGQLRKISYTNSDRNEVNNGYGARLRVDEPTSSIRVEELQSRLQQVQ